MCNKLLINYISFDVVLTFSTCREVGSDVFYSTLPFFQSDWLNEVWSIRQDVQDDYRFVYMGPKGTWCIIISR